MTLPVVPAQAQAYPAESQKYEHHLHRAIIGDGNALAVEVSLFRHTYNTLRPHRALGDQTLQNAYLSNLGHQ